MNNENIYEHRRRVRSGAYPIRKSQIPKHTTSNPNLRDMYSISSNYNIFPQKDRDYDHAYANRPRTADYGADPRQPVSLQGANQLNYASISESSPPSMTENFHTNERSRAIVRKDVKIDPMTRLAQTFNNFANANDFVATEREANTTVVPESVVSPPEFPFTHPLQQPSYDPELPPEEARPPIDGETREQPLSEPDYRVTLEKNILGKQRMASYSYPHVYKDQPFLQLPQMNLIVSPKPMYLHVDSTERNREKYPDPADYVFPLVSSSDMVDTPGERYKNVYEISLLSATIPNLTEVFDYPYLILQIDEIGGHYDSVGAGCKRAFAKLYFDNPGGKFLRVDKGIGDPAVRVFYPKPLASLAKLTVSIRKPDGSLFSFGTDNIPPADPDPELQNSFTFQIITKITDINQAIGHRNI
jgi:hypothetical protein